MKYVYIIKSIPFPDKYYIGCTSDMRKRMQKHNSKNHTYTQRYQPWTLESYFAFKNPAKAAAFEEYLKTSSGRSFSKRHF